MDKSIFEIIERNTAIKIDLSGLAEFDKMCKKLGSTEAIKELSDDALKEMAAAYLGEAKRNTPVNNRRFVKVIKTQKVAGKNTVMRNKRGTPVTGRFYFDSQNTRKSWRSGALYFSPTTGGRIMVYNMSRYASFLNDGHRQKVGQFVPYINVDEKGIAHGAKLKTSWVEGQYMHEKATALVDKNAELLIKRAYNRYLRRCKASE